MNVSESALKCDRAVQCRTVRRTYITQFLRVAVRSPIRFFADEQLVVEKRVRGSMQKEIVTSGSLPRTTSWLDLESLAQVRLTSEDPQYPIEAALETEVGEGWRAAAPGAQSIWLDFRIPQAIEQIYLRFEIGEPRTQEFLLEWSSDNGSSYREIVRQQFNFSGSSPREEETYSASLIGVTNLKLTIIPDVRGGDARASLRSMKIR